MREVMFFDSLLAPVEQPDFETCTKDDFWHLIYSSDYIFIDGEDALKEFKSITNKFVDDEKDSIYSINDTGAYGYFINGEDKWVKVLDVVRDLERLNRDVVQAYIRNSVLPLQGDSEYE